jgi:murein DD-endopeptidase MepM/ murein hydrolase activator NlpD
MLGLTLLYLLVAGKGAGAITGLVGVVTGGVRAFVAPVDPIKKLEGALGAGPIAAAAVTGTIPTAGPGSALGIGGAPIQLSPTGQRHGPNASSGIAGYAAPFTGARPERIDQGQDFALTPGAPIRAIGSGHVDVVEPNWYQGQPLIAYTLDSGPARGRTVYVAEQINPSVKAGQRLAAGQVIGTYAASGTGIETGWGKPSGQTLAQATTGYVEGQVTAAGKSFSNFLKTLGVPTG